MHFVQGVLFDRPTSEPNMAARYECIGSCRAAQRSPRLLFLIDIKQSLHPKRFPIVTIKQPVCTAYPHDSHISCKCTCCERASQPYRYCEAGTFPICLRCDPAPTATCYGQPPACLAGTGYFCQSRWTLWSPILWVRRYQLSLA